MSDPTVLARAVAGDRDAYALLVSEYYSSCLRLATRMLRDRADAEDVVQDVFLRALRALPRYRIDVPFRAWLFRILINQCYTHSKRRSRRDRRYVNDPDAIDRARAHPEIGDGDLDRIARAVDALKPHLREAFLLKYVEEMEYSEMTLVTGIKISTLKMRAKRACEALRPALAELYGD